MPYGSKNFDLNTNVENGDGQDKTSNEQNEESSHIPNEEGEKQKKKDQSKEQTVKEKEESFRNFLSKIFSKEDVRSLADARLTIEEEFEHNLMSERDQLDFLIFRQKQNKNSNGIGKRKWFSKEGNDQFAST